MKMKKYKRFFSVLIVSLLFLFNTTTFATPMTNDVILDKGIISKSRINVNVSNYNKILYKNNGELAYLCDNKLITVKVTRNNTKIISEKYLPFTGKLIKVANVDIGIQFYENKLADSELEELRTSKSSVNIDTKSKTNLMGNIRASLTVRYLDTDPDNLFSDGPSEYCELIDATGTWTREGPTEGVYPESSELYYGVTGSLYYPNGDFYKTGYMGNTQYFSTPAFYNMPLMNGYCSRNTLSAGVTYTLNCSRSVTIEVNMPIYLL